MYKTVYSGGKVMVGDDVTCRVNDDGSANNKIGASLTHHNILNNGYFVDEFLMTVTGKIQKFKMREISIQELGLKRGQTRDLSLDPAG